MSRKFGIDQTEHDFQFTRHWHLNRNGETFVKYIIPEYHNKPILYLELGVFEGMSTTWMFQHVLCHPDSRAVVCDPWLQTRKLGPEKMEAVRVRAYHNLKPWTRTNRCKIIRGNSAEVLRHMCGRHGYEEVSKGSVDVAFVDGNHNSGAVVDDLKHVFKLTKKNGIILVDDVENQIEKEDHVKQGVEMWLKEVGDGVELAWKHRYMEGYRKSL